MNRNSRIAAIAGVAAMALSAPAASHHSFAMFNQRQIMTLDGTIAEFQWTNPHAFIELDVPNGVGRAATRWSIELNSPNNLQRRGWNRTSVRPGEHITLRMAPLRNGEKGGLFLDLVKDDGRTFDSGLPKNGEPVNVPQY